MMSPYPIPITQYSNPKFACSLVCCRLQPDCVPCSVTNMSVAFPCRLCSAFNGKPYQILTCECLIELTRWVEEQHPLSPPTNTTTNATTGTYGQPQPALVATRVITSIAPHYSAAETEWTTFAVCAMNARSTS